MSQDEIIAYLKSNPGWHRTIEIAKATGVNRASTNRALLWMKSHKIESMEWKIIDFDIPVYRFKEP